MLSSYGRGRPLADLGARPLGIYPRFSLRVGVTTADIARQFGESRFVTALLCDLDVATGVFSWIPCGHPPPLLIRGNKVIKELARRPQLPLGLAELHMGTDRRSTGRCRGATMAWPPTPTS